MFPVLNNDYNRWLHLELPLRPTIEKMLASDISNKNPDLIFPCLIVEKRERTPNDEVCYSGMNERLASSFHATDKIDGVNTIIYLNFYYKEHAAYHVYYNARPGDSLSTSSGTVQSHRHMCRISIYSPEKNTRVHYMTISGPTPAKPTDSSDSWGDRIADREVIDRLNLLLKAAPAETGEASIRS